MFVGYRLFIVLLNAFKPQLGKNEFSPRKGLEDVNLVAERSRERK